MPHVNSREMLSKKREQEGDKIGRRIDAHLAREIHSYTGIYFASSDGELAAPEFYARRRAGTEHGGLGMKRFGMKRFLGLLSAAAIVMTAMPASAADKLTISSWGGSWKELIEQAPSPRSSRRETGADVEFITGGTIDRLNKAKLAKGNPESDITFTTSHVGWLYAE